MKPPPLTLNGLLKIIKAVKVTVSAFADNVFDKDYSLISLPELETFPHVNRRLPGLPCAKEVLENVLPFATGVYFV